MVFVMRWSVDSARQDLEPAGMYRLCKKLVDDDAQMARSKPVKKSRKDRRKLSMVSVFVTLLLQITLDNECTLMVML